MLKGRVSWAVFIASLSLFVASAWPGWLNIDSLNMLARATEKPIYDWHSPILIWSWSHLGASETGPLVPFLVQATLFWVGLLLIAARLQRLGWHASWLLFPGALFLDATWAVAWIWKDSLEIALLVTMVGLAVSADITKHERWLWFLISILGAGLVATRWYLAPLGLVAIGALLCMAYPVSRRKVLSVIAVFAVATVGLYSFERFIIKPEASYAAGTLMMLDIARVECSLGTPEDRAQGESFFPAELIREVPGDDICARFSTFAHDPLFMWRDDQLTQTSYVLPDSEASMSRLTNVWLDVVKQYPGVLAEARVKQLVAFLDSDSGMWWSPSSQQMRFDRPIYPKGSIGDDVGDDVGDDLANRWPSASGAPLVVSAAVSSLGSLVLLDFGDSRFGLLALIVVPFGTAIVGWRRGSIWRLRYLPALGFPLLFATGMAVLAPAPTVRYVMPAALWSLAVTALALADRRLETPA